MRISLFGDGAEIASPIQRQIRVAGLCAAVALGLANSPAIAAPYVTLDAYAAMHAKFPCDAWLSSMQGVAKPAMAVVWGTFGGSKACMNKFVRASKGRDHAVLVYVSNQTCYRRTNEDRKLSDKECHPGELLLHTDAKSFNAKLRSGDAVLAKKITARVKEILAWWKANQQDRGTLVLVPGLEDDFGGPAYQAFVDLMRTAGWSGMIGRNPAGSTYQPYASKGNVQLLELHSDPEKDFTAFPNFAPTASGADPRSGMCIANMDSVSVDAGDSQKFPHQVDLAATRAFISRYRDCFGAFLWYAPLQGLDATTDSAKPPRQRTFTLSSDVAMKLNCVMRGNCSE